MSERQLLISMPTRSSAGDGRVARGNRSKQRVIDAYLAFCRDGNFRPTLKDLAVKSGVQSNAILHHYGALDLLARVIAREHTAAVVAASGFGIVPDHKGLAWMIMVGKPRDSLS